MGRSLLTLFHPGKLAMKICQRRDDLAFGFWLSLSQSPVRPSASQPVPLPRPSIHPRRRCRRPPPSLIFPISASLSSQLKSRQRLLLLIPETD